MFAERLTSRIFQSLYQFHENNHDEVRFGPLRRGSLVTRCRQTLKALARKAGFYRIEDVFNPVNQRLWDEWRPHFVELDWLHSTLADEESKSLLVEVIAYRIMGFRHIRLPLSSPGQRERSRKLRSLAVPGQVIATAGSASELHLQDLSSIGYPLRINLPLEAPFLPYVLEQYACPRLGVAVRPGDVVIDAGACWGDTALYFAHRVGDEGRVFAFEFVTENLQVLESNLKLNPSCAERIELVRAPVWSSSGLSFGFSCPGPGARATETNDTSGVPSLSIDDLVAKKQLQKVDFIKMDIEGAEFEALKGAETTLRRHKPDLALCVYHSKEDFTRLARFVDRLNLGYRFALGHFTIHSEETVLFATARNSATS